MKQNGKHKSNLYEYLDTSGVLDTGSDEAIEKARKEYWKKYKAHWRKQKRQTEKELTTSWTVDELKDLTKAARHHNMSRVAFIKSATIAYTHKAFIVPDKTGVQRIAQLLAMNYNLLQEMIDQRTFPLLSGKPILDRIEELEKAVLVSLNSPKTFEQIVTDAIQSKPHLKQSLYQLLETLP
ncbi:MAG: hypothetical protein U9R46_13760 [Bacteroidota bacterium]|nr:hypothetical protein [Bacteroidota bacterium]